MVFECHYRIWNLQQQLIRLLSITDESEVYQFVRLLFLKAHLRSCAHIVMRELINTKCNHSRACHC
ncbi:hypothetical protein T08_8322 [Trichinella sp. T8]|nr:hypothetical protein T08_8322 [Trichinella sp. T8]